MNLFDVLVLGLILLGALHGYRKGLLTSIINFLSYLCAFFVAAKEYQAALQWLERYAPLKQWLEPNVYKLIYPLLQSKASSLEQEVLGNILGALPDQWRNVFASADISGISSSQLTPKLEQVGHSLAGLLTDRLLSIISFGVVFLVVIALIQLVAAILLRPLGWWFGTFNRGGGLLFGGLGALIGLSVLVSLISPLIHWGLDGRVTALIQNSFSYPYLLKIFQVLDNNFATKIDQNLLQPLFQEKGVWF